jgi:hypothetical protein
LRPELKSRTGSMEAVVGGTPTKNYADAIEFDRPLSEGDEKEDVHVDALRIALGAMSYQSPIIPPRTSSRDFAIETVTDSVRELVPKPLRDLASWEPISTADQQQEALDRQRSGEESREEEWGTDSEGTGSENGNEETHPRLNEEEIKEARKLMEHAKAEKQERAATKKEKEKTSIAESFPGRSFF